MRRGGCCKSNQTEVISHEIGRRLKFRRDENKNNNNKIRSKQYDQGIHVDFIRFDSMPFQRNHTVALQTLNNRFKVKTNC